MAIRIELPYLQWHLDLAEKLKRDLVPCCISLHIRGRAPESQNSILLKYFIPGLAPRPADPELAAGPPRPAGLTIDLTARPEASPNSSSLVPLFDGKPGTTALLAALLAGRSPVLEVQCRSSGKILARGCAGLDSAGTPGDAFDFVMSRMGSLLARVIRCHPEALPDEIPSVSEAPPQTIRSADLLRNATRRLAMTALRGAFRLAFYPGHWRIGWRFVGDRDVWDTGDLSGPGWNVLPSPPHVFYADPFPFTWGGRQYLFFEACDHNTNKGHIAAIAIGPAGPEGPVFTVLEEPWHLSYPLIMQFGGEIWMIPESSEHGTVTLYRAAPFPTRWIREADLLSNSDACDATILWHADRFWMFATVRGGIGSPCDMLSLHMAPDLLGPWKGHPLNPLLIDGGSARPAGKFVLRDGRLWRPVQDCQHLYGAGVGLAEIIRLDEGGFEQILRTTIRPGKEWPGRRLHTLNRDGRLEVIDGSARSLRLRSLFGGNSSDAVLVAENAKRMLQHSTTLTPHFRRPRTARRMTCTAQRVRQSGP